MLRGDDELMAGVWLCYDDQRRAELSIDFHSFLCVDREVEPLSSRLKLEEERSRRKKARPATNFSNNNNRLVSLTSQVLTAAVDLLA